MNDDVKFVDGLFVKKPHEKAPDFVKAAISIKRKDLGNWLRAETDEWINIDVKVSQNGKWYAQVNTWKPSEDQVQQLRTATQEPIAMPDKPADDFLDEVPF